MLKRPRPHSPSPTRPDRSSPPPLDSSNLTFRVIKRRRTAGPVLESHERRDPDWSPNDGEDDYAYEDDREEEKAAETQENAMRDKVYERVNHFLHGLHAEHQHRIRAQSTHLQSQPRMENVYAYRDHQYPASSPVKSGKPDYSSFPASHREHVELQESEDGVRQDPAAGKSSAVWGDERLRVTHRYEDTNRLLGSLVLSRRRTLGTPPLDLE